MFAKYSRTGLALMGIPLYAGPVLAGWSAAPPIMIAALAAIFILMQILRGKLATHGTLSPPVLLILLMLVQISVVGVAFALGTALAMVVGALLLPMWLPLVLTGFGASVGVLRYRHNGQQAEMLETIDRAINTIEASSPVDPISDPEPQADCALQEALEALWNLPTDAPVNDMDPIVRRLEEQTGRRAFAGLLSEIGEGSRNVDLAMLRYLASPGVRAELVNADDLGFALSLLLESDDPGVLQELASMIETLLQEDAPFNCFPPAAELREKADQFALFTQLVSPVEEVFTKAQDRCG